MFNAFGAIMDKKIVLKGVAYSLFSPFLIGCLIGIYYVAVLDGATTKLFLSIVLSAVANAHIVGLTMAICVVPVYMYLQKRNKSNKTAMIMAAIFGGALFSFVFNVASGQVFVVNTLMATLAAGIFIFILKQQK